MEATPLAPRVNSSIRATLPSKPDAASTRPAKARSSPALAGRQPRHESPADSHLTGKPKATRRDVRPKGAAPAGGEAQPNPAAPAIEITPVEASAVLDTTAQLCQSPATTLRNRARSKYLTDAIVEGLVRLGERTPLRFAYASTARCAAELVQDGVRVQGKYCRQRWCLVCNRIRTAKLISAYLPEMATWADPHFVTLTIPNVQGHKLHGVVREMLATVPRIARGLRRTDGLELRAVRKLETTYSAGRGDYHPHLHLIVDSREVADALVRRWMKAFPAADAKAQDVRRCAGPKAMRELFKYFTKLVIRGLDGERTAPPPLALDTMFKAVKGLRTFQPMGFVSHVTLDANDEAIELDAGTVSPIPPDSRGRIRWQWIGDDWMDYGSGELLSGFTPGDSMRELVKRITADARAAPG